MKMCIILGTRPEVIKMSPVVRACEGGGMDYFILHTEHYPYEMDRVFFEEMELHEAGYNPDVGENDEGVRECIDMVVL
ncbi:MAG: hypothetical protein U9N61_04855 [Euryarchaeota archaeon]|nr:hypothetical protein [Euryarchaeota archaeon]